MIAPCSRACGGEREREGGSRGVVLRNLRGGERVCRLRGFGASRATQSAACCTLCKVSRVRIGRERFGNVVSVLGWHPGGG